MSLPAQLDPWGAGQSYKWTSGLCSLISHLAVPDIGRIPPRSRMDLTEQIIDHLLQLSGQSTSLLRAFSGGLNVPNISMAPTQHLHFHCESLSPPAPARQQETRCSLSIRIQVIPFSSLQNGNFQYEYKIWKLKDLLILGLDPKSFLRS